MSTTLAPLMVKPTEAAELLSCSRAHVYNLMADGTLPSITIGRMRRIPYAALVALVGEWAEYKRPVARDNRQISPTLRRKVIDRDGRCCQHCGVVIADHERLELDHVIPRSLGGPTTIDNLVVSCPRCNSKKGNKMPSSFPRCLS